MWPQVELGESRVWAGARGVAATAASVLLGIMLSATPSAYAQDMSHEGTVHIENDAERAIFERLRCMCGGCARDLLSTCPCSAFAEPERERIRAKMRAGETRDQIIEEYIAEHGQDSVVIPPNTGVFRAIYAVPIVAIVGGAWGLARMLRRWRAGGPGGREAKKDDAPAGPKDAYDARLDDELKDLDG
jgi:cytochrome c-type biogenesis protein CcmH/NrfF